MEHEYDDYITLNYIKEVEYGFKNTNNTISSKIHNIPKRVVFKKEV